MHLMRRDVGIGSRAQDFLARFVMKMLPIVIMTPIESRRFKECFCFRIKV